MSKRPRCIALTKAGDQCAARAAHGSDHCGAHNGTVGRPTKLTRDLTDLIATAVEHGAYYEQAALAAGIAKTTLYSWRERGEADLEHGNTTTYAYFHTRLTRASATAEQAAAAALFAHRFDDWRAALAYLERRNPDRWGKRDRVEHSGSLRTGEPELVAPDSDEARRQIAELLAAAGALTDPQDD